MKQIIRNITSGKDTKVTAVLALAIFALAVLGCSGLGKSKPAKPMPSEFVGSWTGNDGSTLAVRADGGGDYHQGSFKVENGSAEITDNNELKISFFGIGKTLKIDQAPNNGQMTLAGVKYTKSGFTPTTSSSPSESSSPSTGPSKNPFGDSSSDTPETKTGNGDSSSNAVVQHQVEETIQSFADGVEEGDFSEFRQEKTSAAFKQSNTAAAFLDAFKSFVNQKSELVPVLRALKGKTPTYTFGPEMSATRLKVTGNYPGSPMTQFELDYVKEGGEWKVNNIRIKVA